MGELNLSGWDILVSAGVTLIVTLIGFWIWSLRKKHDLKQALYSLVYRIPPSIIAILVLAALIFLASEYFVDRTQEAAEGWVTIECSSRVSSCDREWQSKIDVCHRNAEAHAREALDVAPVDRPEVADDFFYACVEAAGGFIIREDCRQFAFEHGMICDRLPSQEFFFGF